MSLEYLPLYDLGEYLGTDQTLPEWEAKKVAFQLTNALSFMHRAGFAHRDVTPKVHDQDATKIYQANLSLTR